MSTKRKPAARKKPHTTTRVVHHKAAAPARRRRRSTKAKGMLSELFNPNMAQGALKSMVSGAIGGAVVGYGEKILPADWSPIAKAGIMFGAGFAASSMLKMPSIGAGMAAVATYQLLQSSGMLAEEYDYANPLESLPMVLNEDQAMYLSSQYDLAEGLYEDETVPYFNYDQGWSAQY